MSPADIRFDEQGLVPVVVQEAATGAVLLLAYMNAEALEATLRTPPPTVKGMNTASAVAETTS